MSTTRTPNPSKEHDMAKATDPRKVSHDDMPATERQLAYVASLRKQRDK